MIRNLCRLLALVALVNALNSACAQAQAPPPEDEWPEFEGVEPEETPPPCPCDDVIDNSAEMPRPGRVHRDPDEVF